MACMSRVFLIKAASAISEIAESAKSKMGMGNSKQYNPSKADVNKNGETEAWEKAIAMKRGFKGTPKSKADCPCGESNCDCSEEGTKKEAGAVSETIKTVGKKVGGMFSKGKEKGTAVKNTMQNTLNIMKPQTDREVMLMYGLGGGAVGGTLDNIVKDRKYKKETASKEQEYNKNIDTAKQEANKKVQEAEGKAKKMKERGLLDRVMNKDV
jgi:hypothetical protein